MFLTRHPSAMLPRSCNAAHLSDGGAPQGGPGVTGCARPGSTSQDKIPGEGYEHFTRKEIDEQPQAVAETMRRRVSFETGDVSFEDFTISEEAIANVERILLLGMGTSLHAAMIGRYWIESLARIPCETDNSSEFRYRDLLIDRRTLVISISQSGETADTLAAMEAARGQCAGQLAICNHERARALEIADWSIPMRAGTEVGVAASKTFTCSLTALLLLAIHLGARRGALATDRRMALVRELERLPEMLAKTLEDWERYEKLAEHYSGYSNFYYLGRGNLYPLAMEGALKLKEMSYVHAEGYPAGELKHGPLSLIDENMPVVALVPPAETFAELPLPVGEGWGEGNPGVQHRPSKPCLQSKSEVKQSPPGRLREKMLSAISDVRARGASVFAVANEGEAIDADLTSDVVYVPKASGHVTPILMAVPLQLLAYHIAVRRGCDVDRPRHLVKAVTAE